jgi:predicted RNA-binding protein with PIN domain
MPLLIDGYNLLYALGRLTPNSRRAALEGARRWLVQQLRVRHPPDTAITVVFDSRSAPMGSRGREDQGNIRVVFSHGESADDVIEGLIQNESAPRALMVVSDDHRLQQAGRRRGCKVLGCLDYYEQDLSTPPSQTTPEPTAKPERSTPEDVERYLKAFGDVDDDPLLRDPY